MFGMPCLRAFTITYRNTVVYREGEDNKFSEYVRYAPMVGDGEELKNKTNEDWHLSRGNSKAAAPSETAAFHVYISSKKLLLV